MWPWEHLAAGYLTYSAALHALASRSPTDAEAAMVAFGSQFPDLVDKPLSWTFRVLPSGTSLAHSVFFAVPFSAAVRALARRLGRESAGTAFAIGYLLHLPGDAAYGIIYGRPVRPDALLWPLVPTPPARPFGFAAHLRRYLSRHASFLVTPRGVLFLAAELLFLGVSAVIWARDGRPGRIRLGRRFGSSRRSCA